jgi:predicted transcriptional regulator
MDAIQLPNDLQRAIDQQVQQGRAPSVLAFVEQAVSRLIDDAQAAVGDIIAAAQAGIADAEAGRHITVASPEDSERWQALLLSQALGRLPTET